MPYASEQDMVARYGQDAITVASDRDGSGQSDAGVIETALADAAALIDTYLAGRYPVPLPEVPGTLRRCCVDIALYHMSADAAVSTEEQRKRYEDCLNLLKLLAEGKATLGLEAPPAEAPSRSEAAFVSAPRRFSRETLRGF